MINTVPRRPSFNGCVRTWDESSTNNVIRSTMTNGVWKQRLRFIGKQIQVSTSVRIKKENLQEFKDWFDIDLQGGVQPTLFKTPYGVEEPFRFVGPPNYNWIDPKVVEARFTLEQLSGWLKWV